MDEVEALKVLHRLVSVFASAHLSVKADSKRLVATWHRSLTKLRNVAQKSLQKRKNLMPVPPSLEL
jgi:hypothetical protein